MYNGVKQLYKKVPSDQEQSQEQNIEEVKLINFKESENKVDLQASWAEVLQLLAKKIKKYSFKTWIKPTQLIELNDEFAVIAVKNEFTRNFIGQSYLPQIHAAIKEVFAKSISLQIIVDAELEPTVIEIEEEEASFEQPSFSDLKLEPQEEFIKSPIEHITKNPNEIKANYSFETFVAGLSNQMVFNFAKTFASSSSRTYRSLFVQAETGLGKTHILHAIANEAKKYNRDLKIKYINAENFINELVSAIKSNKTNEFRSRYRKLDLLLFDEIQFLEGKKSSQEEFVFTFDSIVNAGGKVVLSSSKPTALLNKLDANLRSRINGSLTAQIDSPDLMSRVAIMRHKALEHSLDIKDEHLEIIARKHSSNIRELEGALLKISAYEACLNQESPELGVDDETISRLFGSVYSAGVYQGLSIEKIVTVVSEYFGIAAEDIRGNRRLASYAKARHIAIYLARELLELSHQRIGVYFSNRKHSSIIHSIKVIKIEKDKDRSLSLILSELIDKLQSN